MRYFAFAVVIALSSAALAGLPRIGVLALDVYEGVDPSAVIGEVEAGYRESGRFEVVDVSDLVPEEIGPENIAYSLDGISSEANLDVILALDVRPPVSDDYTTRRNDSLINIREVSVEVSGRFYSSAGSLIGTVSEMAYDERQMPYSPDVEALAMSASRSMVDRSLLELFPIEVRYTAGPGDVQQLPEGRAAGIEKGMVMSVIGSSRRVPTSEEEYALLGSRGLMQIISASAESSRARLLAGGVVPGGPVTAVESGNPAAISISYQACPSPVEAGDSLQTDDTSLMVNRLRIEGRTAKWGLAFGGALNAATADRISSIGVEGMMGTRLPLSAPGLAVGLYGGGGMSFAIQETAVDTLASDASGFSFGGMARVSLEALLSAHLGLEAGVTGRLYSTIDSWNVQEYSGRNRDAEPSELYYTELSEAPASFHAGLWYLIY
jgi:hypothetical protein